jgi:enterochelin esterase-like enzyme
MCRGRMTAAVLAILVMTLLAGCGSVQNNQATADDKSEEKSALQDGSSVSGASGLESGSLSDSGEEAKQNHASGASGTDAQGSRLETVSYSISYEGKEYAKTAEVYVPAAYTKDAPMNILYLMHGSTGSAEQTAESFQPLLDDWIQSGDLQPLLVVFPTYYPDRTFVTPNYSEDYPLNHFFATDELLVLIRTVEGQYRTYAEGTGDTELQESRAHRAFGGYSMGGVTTWEVLTFDAPYFRAFMPMAGDSWLSRSMDISSDAALADAVLQGIKDGGYQADDLRIVAMVGENDGTKYSMQPQIEAMRRQDTSLITDENLLYWENAGGGHSMESMVEEVHHGIPLLWKDK